MTTNPSFYDDCGTGEADLTRLPPSEAYASLYFSQGVGGDLPIKARTLICREGLDKREKLRQWREVPEDERVGHAVCARKAIKEHTASFRATKDFEDIKKIHLHFKDWVALSSIMIPEQLGAVETELEAAPAPEPAPSPLVQAHEDAAAKLRSAREKVRDITKKLASTRRDIVLLRDSELKLERELEVAEKQETRLTNASVIAWQARVDAGVANLPSKRAKKSHQVTEVELPGAFGF